MSQGGPPAANPGGPGTRESDLAAIAALNEPLRRRLYDHVASQPGAVSRDGAAAALQVPRSVAAFHLDKLAELGLLEVEYRRPPGRRGPGAGRPAKLYRRAAGEVALSVPERRYSTAAALLARAVDHAAGGSVPVAEALGAAAREHGRALGAGVGPLGRSGRGLLANLAVVLAENGYEPRMEGGRVLLANCPFHSLAEEHPELICGMNHELISGLLEAIGGTGVEARLDPGPGRCCVTLVAG